MKSSVLRFNHIKGTPPETIDGDRNIFWEKIERQAELVYEEAREQLEAARNRDIVEVVDGAADVAYTQAYMDVMLEEVGVNLNKAKYLVCDNNDQKFTVDEVFAKRSAAKILTEDSIPCYVDETWYEGLYYYVVKRKQDGKVLKLIGHQSPDIKEAIPEETFKFVGEKNVAS